MATITTRSGKGSPLTNSEVDSNFSNINTELGQKESASNKGVANGYASLDGSGKVPSAQLPSYVDDVVEGANLASLPATGETGKIYVTLDTNKTYRWSGSAYVEISASPGSTDAVTEGSTNLYFTNARARSAISASGSLSYNSSTGVLSYTAPTAVSQLSNDSGYITSSALSSYLTSATAASTYQTALVSGTSIKTVNGNSLLGSGNIQIDAGVSSFNTRTGAITLTSGDVTTALGFTPYNATNPSGYITSSSNITGTAAGITGYTIDSENGTPTTLMSRNTAGDSSVGSRFHFKTATALDGMSALVGLNWGGAAGTYKNFAVYDYPNSRVVFRAYGETRNFEVFGALTVGGNTALHAANYNSYSPTLTGTGASGTWGISITGNANYASSAGSASTATRSTIEDTRAAQRTPNAYDDYRASYEFTNQIVGSDWHTAFTMQGWHDGYAAWQIIGPASTSAHENFYLRSGINTTWNSARTILHSGNYSSYSAFSGLVTSSGNNGFANATWFASVRNPIWSFGNSSSYGISYFQGSAGRDGTDTITLHPNGSTTATGAAFAANGNNAFVNNNVVLNAANYTSYSPSLTGSGASGTWSISTTSDFLHSDRDFPSGTLITTDINYAVSSGDPFVLEIRGNSYGSAVPLDIQCQGYIYSDTIINHGGIANGLNISGLVAINNGGNLCFWFPSQGYWNGYYVKVYVPYSGRQRNRVTSISGSGKPTTAKEVGLSANIRQSLHSGNYTSYSPSLTGSGASGTWSINVTGNAGSASSLAGGGTINNANFNGIMQFPSGASGATFGANHYSMGKDIANGGWSHPHYSDLIIGYHTGIRIGGAYSGVRFYNNSPTTDANNDGNGDAGEALLMTVGGHAGGTGVIINNTLTAGNALIGASQVLHAGNYTSYSPSLTGSGASGTWGISISGSAAQLNGYSSAENGASVVLRTGSNGYLYLYNWIHVASGGLFSGVNSAHFSPNTGSYGPWRISGTRNGWSGIEFDSGVALMTNRNSMGLYDTSYGWTLYWSGGTGYVHKNANGGGTQAAILDSSNYTSYSPSLTGSGASGSWNITAARANRANGNFYIDDNYGIGVVGLYSSVRYQGVFAMGDSYKLPADGTSAGNLYGIAWSYPSAGGVAGNLDSHGMLVLINGGFGSCMSYSIKASGNVTAYSDERLKTNWRPMPTNYVERLASVKVGIYDRTDGEQMTQVGVSAQSFQELLPEAITKAGDEMGTLSVSYGNAAMASAVELAKELVMLKRELAEIKSRLH